MARALAESLPLLRAGGGGGGGGGGKAAAPPPAGTASASATWFAVVCTMAGSGILQLPLTLKQGGWFAVLLIAGAGAVACRTGKLLVAALYAGAPPGSERLRDYPDVGEAAFGRPGRIAVLCFYVAQLFGVGCIFLVLVGKFMLEGLGGGGEGLFPSMGGAAQVGRFTKMWTGVAAAACYLPAVGCRTLSEAHGLAVLGLVATAATVGVVVFYAFHLHPVEVGDDLPLPDGFDGVTHTLFDAAGLAPAFAAIALSFGGHANFPSIEAGMRNPRDWPRVLDRAFVALVAAYVLTACAGYWTFGSATYSPILCNLNRDGKFGVGVQVTKLLIALHVICAYPIVMSALFASLEGALGADGEGRRAAALRLAVRTAVVAATAAVAIFVPFFPQLMTLVGGVACSVLVFVLPVLLDLKLKRWRASRAEWAFAALALTLGPVGGAVGAVQGAKGIMQLLR